MAPTVATKRNTTVATRKDHFKISRIIRNTPGKPKTDGDSCKRVPRCYCQPGHAVPDGWKMEKRQMNAETWRDAKIFHNLNSAASLLPLFWNQGKVVVFRHSSLWTMALDPPFWVTWKILPTKAQATFERGVQPEDRRSIRSKKVEAKRK